MREIQKYKANMGTLEWSSVARKFARNSIAGNDFVRDPTIKRLSIQTNKKLKYLGNTERRKLYLNDYKEAGVPSANHC